VKNLTRFEKLMVALAAAWLLEAAAGPALHILAQQMSLDRATNSTSYIAHESEYYAISGAAKWLPRIVFGVWLYLAAKYESERKWLWGALGFFGGIYGVLIFYPYLILTELRKGRLPNQAPRTPVGVTPAAGASVAPPPGAAGL
jgi:hypothetical protein